MPFYRFHVDVPAEASMVRERLRAATSHPDDRWIDKPLARPFYGRVENDTFRIQRNVGAFRGYLLPRILGRLTPVGAGARLTVTMTMSPAVFLLLVFWSARLGYAASMSFARNSQAFLILLLTLLCGLGLGIGTFYLKAWKARRLLIDTATNAIERSAQDQFLVPKERTAPSRDDKIVRIAVWGLAALLLIFGAATIIRQRQQLRACPAFRQAEELAANSAAAREVLGSNIKVAGFARGFVQDRSEFGYAFISIPVQGLKSNGTVHGVANRVKGEWRLERVALWTHGKAKRIDLSPAVRRETFSYPAQGGVYLIPFDKESARQLAELPAYYAARLGLRTTILRVMRLPRQALDAASEQVIAERAVDFMERTALSVNAELDAVFVGVTSRDLSIRSSGWSDATNYRIGRFGIISTARLHGVPGLANGNPEIFPERIRKLVTKNLVLLRYPISLSADPTSVLANYVVKPAEVDRMTEEVLGQAGKWLPLAGPSPCFSVTQGSHGEQSWSDKCDGSPPNDSRFETFDHYTATTSIVVSRTDFPFAGDRRLSLIRRHWEKDDASRSFGVGGNDSFDIFPVGDSRTFSWIDLIHEDGSHTSFRRTSFGTGYADAKLVAAEHLGDPFSKSTLKWSGNGWDLNTFDGWSYQLPSSGPNRSGQQSALTGIASPLAHISIRRDQAGVPIRIDGLAGATIEFQSDERNRIIEARHSSGHSISYRYAANGRLGAINDSSTGAEHYEYDQADRLVRILDARGNPELSITYGYSGEITEEALADGRTLRFMYAFDPARELRSVSLVDDRGYKTEWTWGRGGYYQSLPERVR